MNFGGLFIVCIDADCYVQIRILQLFAAIVEIYKIQKPFAPLQTLNFANFDDSFLKFCQILVN